MGRLVRHGITTSYSGYYKGTFEKLDVYIHLSVYTALCPAGEGETVAEDLTRYSRISCPLLSFSQRALNQIWDQNVTHPTPTCWTSMVADLSSIVMNSRESCPQRKPRQFLAKLDRGTSKEGWGEMFKWKGQMTWEYSLKASVTPIRLMKLWIIQWNPDPILSSSQPTIKNIQSQ